MTRTRPTWMPHAWAERDVHEIAGPACHVRIGEYLRTVGLPSDDAIPWCSAFANWVVQAAGFAPTGSARARSWLTWGVPVPLDTPEYGAVVVFKRGTDPTLGHVTFYVDTLPAGTLLCLGGNQRDQVGLSAYDPAHLLGVRWAA